MRRQNVSDWLTNSRFCIRDAEMLHLVFVQPQRHLRLLKLTPTSYASTAAAYRFHDRVGNHLRHFCRLPYDEPVAASRSQVPADVACMLILEDESVDCPLKTSLHIPLVDGVGHLILLKRISGCISITMVILLFPVAVVVPVSPSRSIR
eukprot:gnl/TRDRNA2_/TRDRNA2_139410_c0_seq1.p1 gnl/TRDRNA2_/TRDRNA2_139410_c0~~gnl/TRDRNA2_/TRDRNA2_139410_c0_seq1.p1  ORF type:complete len:149 (-),score=11.82 gnl/TRDRNA2_/TRDRNA2_139410_c0_seq1:55-501(-)